MSNPRPHALIGAAASIPVPDAQPILTYSYITLPSPSVRPAPLQLKIAVPAGITAKLPIIILAHGQGVSNWLSSSEGYTPVASFWAARGFAVIQPTFLRSKTLSLQAPEGNEMYWMQDSKDMSAIIDQLHLIEDIFPGGALKAKLDRDRIAVVGHSAGSIGTQLLLGAKNTDSRNGNVYTSPDPRIKAGIIIGGLGSGGAALSENGRTRLIPFWDPDFSGMQAPMLVVYGDDDASPHLSDNGMEWHADAYRLAPGKKDMLELKGCKHGFGGISGWDAGETQDESPERLGVIQRMTWAYLWSVLSGESETWEGAKKVFAGLDQGKVGSKE